jgi:AAA family ATP:ADP antiporter
VCVNGQLEQEQFVPSTAADLKGKSALERFLSLFANVHPGEGLTAFLLATNIFILLTAYYVIKPVREALILSGAGAEIKSYAGAGQALLFLLIVPLYSAYASRTNRGRLINGVFAFFISNLAIFYLLGRMQVRLGVVFFLWVGMFNVLLVAQYWAFANDIYTEQQGRRLLAIVGIGSALGAIAGARVAGWLFEPIGPYSMMLVAAALLGVCMVLTAWIHRREGVANRQRSGVAAQTIGTSGGFRLVFRQRYLFLIAVMVLLSNLVNTTGEFILGKTVAEYAKNVADSEAYIGAFYAEFFFWVNLLGAALQLFAVSRILKYVGIGPALFALPVIALGSYTVLAFVPILGFIRLAKIAENSTDYSIQNTTRHALFLNTSRDAKYKAQSTIESFFWRTGDALSALLVFIGTRLAFDISKFAVVNILLVFVWLCVVATIVRQRRHQRTARSAAA